MSAASSRGSAASTSASSGRGSRSPGRSSSTRGAGASSRGTSPARAGWRTSARSGRGRSPRSTSSAVASPARTSRPPARAPGSTAPARVFGPSSPDSFASFDPATSSWRTCPRSSPGKASGGTGRRSEEFSETWPRQGMTRSGRAFPLVSSGHPTCERGSGSSPTRERVPTPTHADSRASRNSTAGRRPGARPAHAGNTLTDFVTLFPTPSATEPDTWRYLDLVDKDGNPPSHPNQRLYDKKTGRVVQKTLEHVALSWPTPTVSDGRKGRSGAPRPEDRRGRETLSGTVHARAAEAGRPTPGRLNPEWVEWLMGFPIGWTDSPASATPSSRRSPSGSDGASSSTRRGR